MFFAKRPLRQEELLHALALSGSNPQVGKNIPAVSHVLDSCAGLIVVDDIHGTVGFFHKTVDDFLVKNHSTWFPCGDKIIGPICVDYLSLDAFANGPVLQPVPESEAEDRTLYESRVSQFPFYEYASEHWHDHVRGTDLETADSVKALLADANKLSASMEGREYFPRTTGVHVAVQHSLNSALDRHLELYLPQVNVKDHFGRTPLSYAAVMNNLAAARRLIKAGADPNFLDDDFEASRLKFRRIETHDAFAYHKIKGYADLCTHPAREGACVSPLSFAAMEGHSRMVGFLLKAGACVNHQNALGQSALLCAARNHQAAAVKVLLQHGSTVDCQDSWNDTPLRYAARHAAWSSEPSSSSEVASALLDHGANVNHKNIFTITPLSSAAADGDEKMISLLI